MSVLPVYIPAPTSSGVSGRLFTYFLFFLVIYWPISFHRIFVLAFIYLLLYNGLSTLSEISTLSSLVTIYMSYLFLIYCIFSLIYWQTSCRSLLIPYLSFGIMVYEISSYVAAKNLYNFLLLYISRQQIIDIVIPYLQ